jgi:hypothetical protein
MSQVVNNVTVPAVTAQDAIEAIVINACRAFDYANFTEDCNVADRWMKEFDNINAVLVSTFFIKVEFDFGTTKTRADNGFYFRTWSYDANGERTSKCSKPFRVDFVRGGYRKIAFVD